MPEAHLVCVECGAVADWSAAGWEAHLVNDEREDVSVFVFCPRCALREFHSDESEPPHGRRA